MTRRKTPDGFAFWILALAAAWALAAAPPGAAASGDVTAFEAPHASDDASIFLGPDLPSDRPPPRTITPRTPALHPASLSATLASAPAHPPLLEPDLVWVETTLTSMTLEQKIGQMLMLSSFANAQSRIDDYHVGGFIFTGNNQQAATIVATANSLQAHSPLPLWFSIDAEAGLGARVADATVYPLIMGIGATDDPDLAELCGRVTARECRALGVHIAFGPVVDVNTEPINPIISTRAYGDDPALVTRLARGFIRGARSEGLLCTFKHYPGHGATAGDSHSELPVVDLPLETLEDEHIKPYRDLAGTDDVDFVMTAHVWFSQVDTEYGKPWPATLSPVFLDQILRQSIGYDNLIISDAYAMEGLAVAVPDQRERAVLGIEAGLDVILGPPNVHEAFHGIRDAVLDERISRERIDASVRRILTAKTRVGLHQNRFVDPTDYEDVLRHPEHVAAVRLVCERGFTAARNTLGTNPPVADDDNVLLLDITRAGRTIFYIMPSSHFIDPFTEWVPGTTVWSVPASVDTTERDAILADAATRDIVVAIGYDWTEIASGSQVALINALTEGDTPVVYVAFGAPYHYTQIPDVDAFYCGYSSVAAMQEVAAEVLTGRRAAQGSLPVSIPGLEPAASVHEWMME